MTIRRHRKLPRRESWRRALRMALEPLEPRLLMAAQPHLVLVNVDDMRADSMQYMPFTSNTLAGEGTVFQNSFVPTALSGPSRASLLTGLYAHNTGVLGNSAPLGGAANRSESNLATWLHDAGYRTGIFGKYETNFDRLDSSNDLTPPPGWDEFHVRLGGTYYNIRENLNGVAVQFGTAPEDYATDLFAAQADEFLRTSDVQSQPLFLYFAPTAPHNPFTPAPRHVDAFPDLLPPRPPSFNQVPPDVSLRLPLSDQRIQQIDQAFLYHTRSLLAVDEAIQRLYNTLDERGILDDTVFVFTSDNGFLWTEHGISTTKHTFNEEALRVPLVIRDGRDPVPRQSAATVLNIDLAPTLAELAGVVPPDPVDGVSLVPAIHGDPFTSRESFLLEDWWEPFSRPFTEGFGTSGYGIRTSQWKYAEYESGRRELFDLVNDSAELVNLVDDPGHAALVAQLAGDLDALRPTDTAGPRIENLSHDVALDARGNLGLRIAATADDTASGGSQVRTPVLFVDSIGVPTSGIVLAAIDGVFHSAVEDVRRFLPAEVLTGLSPGNHALLVRGRDAGGNWGPVSRTNFNLAAAPVLHAASDTGASASDGLTVSRTQRLDGHTLAGATVTLYALSEGNILRRLGTTAADSNGNWSFTARLGAGRYRVYAGITKSGEPSLLTAATTLHVAASIDSAGVVSIRGTDDTDQLVANADAGGRVIVNVNNVSAGELLGATSIVINGMNGDDTLVTSGTLPATLLGEEGDDNLFGGQSNDQLDGGPGINELRGQRGNDRYLFRSRGDLDFYVQIIQDSVQELPGEGIDVLDFSAIDQPVIVNLHGRELAHYHEHPRFGDSRRIVVANNNRAIEQVVGGAADDSIAGPATLTVAGSRGNDAFAATSAAGSSTFIRALSIDPAGAANVLVTLATSHGTLNVRTNIGGGITPAQVTGNGTGRIEMRATRSQINVTLLTPNGLSFTPAAGVDDLAEIAGEVRAGDGQPVIERNVARIAIGDPTFTGSPLALSVGEDDDPRLVAPALDLPNPLAILANGRLTLYFSTAASPGDHLAIESQGNGPGEIGFDGRQVRYGGVLIGNVAQDGRGGNPLIVDLTGAATMESVQALARRVSYAYEATAIRAPLRALQVLLRDTAGDVSAIAKVNITVVAANDQPLVIRVSNSRMPVIYREGGPPARMADLKLLEEEGNFAGGRITVEFFGFAEREDRISVFHEGPGRDRIRLSGNTVMIGGAVLGTTSWQGTFGEQLVIQLSENATRFRVLRLLKNIAYDNTSQNARGTFRQLKFVVRDGGGVSSAPFLGTILLHGTNDVPRVEVGAPVTWQAGDPPRRVAAGASVRDPDQNLGGGVLTIFFDGFSESTDRLGIFEQGTGPGQIHVVSGNRVMRGSSLVGIISSFGVGGEPLTIALADPTIASHVQELVRCVTFQSVAQNPTPATRQLRFLLRDALGDTNAPAIKQVNVTNDQ